jgi:hypothetical protein
MDVIQPSTCGGRNDPQYFAPSNTGFQSIKFAVIRHQNTFVRPLFVPRLQQMLFGAG